MPKPVYSDVRLFQGDCLEVMRGLSKNSVDSIVVDPPYGLKFMGKKWDHNVPSVEVWQEALRVLKPGGFLLSFGGCRTYHRLVCNIEDAGFTIHPLIAWVFSQGFPKATNLSKMIDKAVGAQREVVGKNPNYRKPDTDHHERWNNAVLNPDITAPATEAAKQWDGWFYGLQCLKPATEPVCMAQKPYDGKPIESIQKWGTGAINIDRCRVSMNGEKLFSYPNGAGGSEPHHMQRGERKGDGHIPQVGNVKGRFPANFIWSHHPECVQVGVKKVKGSPCVTGNESSLPNDGTKTMGKYALRLPYQPNADADGLETVEDWDCHPDCPSRLFPEDNRGSAARFFKQCLFTGEEIASLKYCAKASKADRGKGNTHNTVKPINLMRYLCRLITPPGGVVLDPYMGSGSTGKAAILEGFKFVGIELEEDYSAIAEKRIEAARKSMLV